LKNIVQKQEKTQIVIKTVFQNLNG